MGTEFRARQKPPKPDKRIKSSKAGGRRVLSGLTEGDGSPKEMRSMVQQPMRQGRPVAQKKNGTFPYAALEHFKEDSDMIHCLERDYGLTAGSFINERHLSKCFLDFG